MMPTSRSRANTGSRSAPLTAASVAASASIATAETGIGPAGEVAPRAVDLPRRETERRRQLRPAAACARDLGHGAHLHGECGDHGHRVGAAVERVPQRDERLAVTAGDRRIGDGERVGLDRPAVVLGNDRLGDVAGAVGDELPARRREFAQVFAERRDERAQARPG